MKITKQQIYQMLQVGFSAPSAMRMSKQDELIVLAHKLCIPSDEIEECVKIVSRLLAGIEIVIDNIITISFLSTTNEIRMNDNTIKSDTQTTNIL